MSVFGKIMRAGEGKILRKLHRIADQVSSIEEDFVNLTDAELRALTDEYRERLADGESLDDLLPACAGRGVSVLAAAVFNSGILAELRPAAGARYEYAQAPPETLRRAHRIADVCEAHGVTLPRAAMAFPLRHPVVAGVVLGMRSAGEVRRDIEAFGAGIPEELWTDLYGQGLIDERAQAPG